MHRPVHETERLHRYRIGGEQVNSSLDAVRSQRGALQHPSCSFLVARQPVLRTRQQAMLTLDPRSCPEGESEITIDFEQGVPVGLNGYRIPAVQLLEDLNEIAGTNGIGRADCVENRVVGMKSRGVYETPGGTLITTAHRELESLVLDRQTRYHKDMLAITYSQMVYEGQWFTPLREAFDAFFDKKVEENLATPR